MRAPAGWAASAPEALLFAGWAWCVALFAFQPLQDCLFGGLLFLGAWAIVFHPATRDCLQRVGHELHEATETLCRQWEWLDRQERNQRDRLMQGLLGWIVTLVLTLFPDILTMLRMPVVFIGCSRVVYALSSATAADWKHQISQLTRLPLPLLPASVPATGAPADRPLSGAANDRPPPPPENQLQPGAPPAPADPSAPRRASLSLFAERIFQ